MFMVWIYQALNNQGNEMTTTSTAMYRKTYRESFKKSTIHLKSWVNFMTQHPEPETNWIDQMAYRAQLRLRGACVE